MTIITERPWGQFESLGAAANYHVKLITVLPGQILSLQKHQHRSEHWIVIAGTARVTIDETISTLATNEATFIPLGAVHRLENPGDSPLQLIEVQTGNYFGEDDIIRLDDIYGRS